jgi:uncharacterized caspase-like protein
MHGDTMGSVDFLRSLLDSKSMIGPVVPDLFTALSGRWLRSVLSSLAGFAFLFLLAVGADVALAAEKRLALVVGNARYPALALNNPENDARVVASTLRRLGFEVTEHVNLPMKEFRKVLRDYAKRLQSEEGASVFYYAGHGVQIDGRNYLLPVDVNLRDEDEVRDEGVDVDELFVSRLERARTQVRIVILDACRDNPFSPKTRAIRGSGGLAEMAARGALIAYASAPGATAEDGPPGTNSVYTRHLVKEMLIEGIEVEQMFKNVRVKVVRDTNQRQVPWVNTSLTANFSFNPKRGPAEEDAAKRDDLARLQALLDQREREQKKLEEEVARLTRQMGRGEGGEAAKVAVPVPAVPKDLPAQPLPSSRKQSGTVTPAPLPPVKESEPAAPATAAPAPRKETPPAPAVAAPAPAAPAPAAPAAPRKEAPPPAVATPPPAVPVTAKAASPPTTAAPPAAAKASAPAEPAPVAKSKAAASAVAARPERPPAQAAAEAPAKATKPAERVAKASGGGNAASERCVALLIRAQLGEPMPPAEMAYLQKECR